MHHCLAKVSRQLLSSRTPVAHGGVFAGAHQDDALSGGKDLRNHLLAHLVIDELDRPPIFVVALPSACTCWYLATRSCASWHFLHGGWREAGE
jgi:hypothetical protein